MKLKTSVIMTCALLGVIAVYYGSHTKTINTSANHASVPSDVLDARNESHPITQAATAKAKTKESVQPDASPETALTIYKEWAKYPPNSRPIQPGQWHIIEPHMTHSAAKPLISKKNKAHASGFECTLQPQQHTFTEGTPVSVTLLCSTSEGDSDTPQIVDVELKSLSMSIITPAGTTAIAADRIKFSDPHGNRLYLFSLIPTSKDWGEVIMEIKITIPADTSQEEYQLATSFKISPVAPAQFTGQFSDHLENGSLIVDVEVNVDKPGRFIIAGNLNVQDEPIAHATEDLYLEQGVHRVPLLFFGKILREFGMPSGTYTLTNVRGHRLNLASRLIDQKEPEIEGIPQFTDEFRTAPYELNQFSDAEWDSPEKQLRIKDLEQAMNNTDS